MQLTQCLNPELRAGSTHSTSQNPSTEKLVYSADFVFIFFSYSAIMSAQCGCATRGPNGTGLCLGAKPYFSRNFKKCSNSSTYSLPAGITSNGLNRSSPAFSMLRRHARADPV